MIIATGLQHPFGVAVFSSLVYWTDWDTGSIHFADKDFGSGQGHVDLKFGHILDLKIFHRHRTTGGLFPLIAFLILTFTIYAKNTFLSSLYGAWWMHIFSDPFFLNYYNDYINLIQGDLGSPLDGGVWSSPAQHPSDRAWLGEIWPHHQVPRAGFEPWTSILWSDALPTELPDAQDYKTILLFLIRSLTSLVQENRRKCKIKRLLACSSQQLSSWTFLSDIFFICH